MCDAIKLVLGDRIPAMIRGFSRKTLGASLRGQIIVVEPSVIYRFESRLVALVYLVCLVYLVEPD
jgi:hypothetical protein